MMEKERCLLAALFFIGQKDSRKDRFSKSSSNKSLVVLFIGSINDWNYFV